MAPPARFPIRAWPSPSASWSCRSLWGILTALKPEADAFDNSLSSFAHATEFGNFVTAWDYGPFGRFLLNGLVVACGRGRA